MKKLTIVAAVAAALLSTACVTTNPQGGLGGMGQKETIGAGAGALAGTAIGNIVCKSSGGADCMVARVIGAAAGGFLGSKIGASLDAEDQAKLAAASAQVLNEGGTASFKVKDGGTIKVSQVDEHGNLLAKVSKTKAKAKPKTAPKKIIAKAPAAEPAPVLAVAPTEAPAPAAPAADEAKVSLVAVAPKAGDCKFKRVEYSLGNGRTEVETVKECLKGDPAKWISA